MKKLDTKLLAGKMADYRRFAIVLLAVGVFFYLGVIIPTETKTELQLNIMMAASFIFIAGSLFFFNQAKIIKNKLLEIEEKENL